MTESLERWLKIIGLGLLVWLAPFLIENSLYYLQMYNEQVYNPLFILVGITAVLIAAAAYLPGVRLRLNTEGWVIGVVWYGVSMGLDTAFQLFIATGKHDIVSFLFTNGWMHLYIPIAAVLCGYLAHAVEARSSVVTTGPTLFPIR